ncbi:MAG: hypothetical protein KKA54_09370 [Proteobacteria bacterium]|nr:hypothetical protein [Pseudomonadota bacterium]
MNKNEDYEFVVEFSYTEKSKIKKAKLTIRAKSEAEALQKAKEKLSLHPEGKNYQVIPEASISRK